METEKLKRGIELTNRLGENSVGKKLETNFSKWKGKKAGKITVLSIGLVFILNLILSFPFLLRDTSISYSSSSSLALLRDLFAQVGIPGIYFFGALSFVSILLSPVSLYIFVRKIFLENEIIAFLAVLLFILPSPIWEGGLPLVRALLSGDGAHALAFTFIPLLYLLFEAYLTSGSLVQGAVSAVAIAIIAFVSPFALFNLLIFLVTATLAEGFMGNFRVKIGRFLLLLIASFALSVFWYYPKVIGKIMLLSHVNLAIQKLWLIIPLSIPAIPVVGIFLFLIFDRREKLKPIFISVFLFGIYLYLYLASINIKVSGIFTAQRYLMELSLARSFIIAVLAIVLIELLHKEIIRRVKKGLAPFVSIAIACLAGAAIIIFSLQSTLDFINNLYETKIHNQYTLGIGGIERAGSMGVLEIISTSISLITIAVLAVLLFRRKSAIFNKLVS